MKCYTKKKKFMAKTFLENRVCPKAGQERTGSWGIQSAPPAAGPVGTNVHGPGADELFCGNSVGEKGLSCFERISIGYR